LRIGIDATVIYGRYTGVARAVVGLIRGLAEVDDENDYVLYCGRDIPPIGELPANFRWRTRPMDVASRLRVVYWQQSRLDADAREDGVDVLHCPAYVAPMRGRTKTVLSVYDAHVFTHPEYCSWLNRMHYRQVMPHALGRAARIFCPSCATRDVLVQRLRVGESRIVVVPLGVERRFRRILKPDVLGQVRTALELPEHFVLFVGNLEPRKGVPRLLEAFIRARKSAGFPHKLVIAGKPGDSAKAVMHAVEAPHAREHVMALGYVSDACLPHLYNLAAAVICPAPFEGFGFTALEAMACGAPVLANGSGALPEVCGDAALYVQPRHVEPLAEAIRRMLSDEGLRHRLIAQGLTRAERFQWATTARVTLATYEEVFGG